MKSRMKNYWKTLTLTVILTLQAGYCAYAAGVAGDNANGKAPVITSAGNGVPVVNIRTPNAKALSHNQYKNFNVDSNGLIFNNAKSGSNVKTQLGGYIMGNGNITTQSAKTILNEVTTNTASKINGFMEVAGDKANVIISNPNGIQIGNSGYINTNKAILTTGKPKIGTDGELNGFNVEGGMVDISDLGLDATGTSSADIYAQAVKINAKVCAENLNIVTGKNEIDTDGRVTKILDDAEYTGVSLDVGALGGLYAGVIKMVGTAKGLGVNTAGGIYAQKQLVLDENGEVVVKENGKIVSKANSTITIKDKLTNHGEISTETDILNITAKQLTNNGSIISGDTGTVYIDDSVINGGNAELIAVGGVVLNANTLINSGFAGSGENSVISLVADLINNGQIVANKNLTVTAKDITSDTLLVDKDLNIIAAGAITNNNRIQSGGDTNITAVGDFINSNEMVTGGVLVMSADNITNKGSITDDGDITITAKGYFVNSGNQIASNGNLSILADGNITSVVGEIFSYGMSTLNSKGDIINGSNITSGGELAIAGRSFDNTGKIISGSTGDIVVTNTFANKADIAVNSNLNIKAGDFATTNALTSGGNLNIQSDSTYTNIAVLTAVGDITIATAGLTVSEQILSGGNGVFIVDGDFLNNSTIVMDGNFTFSADSVINNEDKEIIVGGSSNVTVTDGDITNKGTILSGGVGIYKAIKGTLNNSGSLKSNSGLTTSAKNITNTGTLASIGEGIHTATEAISNTGLINGAKNTLNAGTIFSNTEGGKVYGDDLSITAKNINNTAEAGASKTPILAARNNLTLTVDGGTINNKEHATILALNDIVITANTLNNNSATIDAGNTLTLNVQTINNTNEHFAYEKQVKEEKDYEEIQPAGTDTHYVIGTGEGEYRKEPTGREFDTAPEGYDIYYTDGQDATTMIVTPGGTYYRWYDYFKHVIVEEDMITRTDPGLIISGGDMTIIGTVMNNDRSKIIAGKDLNVNIINVNNIDQEAYRYITERGQTVTKTRKVWAYFVVGEDGTEYRVDEDKLDYDSEYGYSYWDGSKWLSVTERRINEEYQESLSRYHYDYWHHGTYDDDRRSSSDIINISESTKQVAISLFTQMSGHSIVADVDSSQIIDNTASSVSVSGADNTEYMTVKAKIDDTELPVISITGALYTQANPDAHYYIETDPEFANFDSWLSSDYFFEKMNTDPVHLAKRLGDAYYEQNKIKEQVIQQTGSRYLEGYTSDEKQYQDLMDNAVNFAKMTGLTVGVSPTAEQLEQLIEPMVWIELRKVQLPSGETVFGLVPELYLPKDYAATHNSAVISGVNVNLLAQSNVTNTGTVLSHDDLVINADNISNLYGFISGVNVEMVAKKDIVNEGGSIIAQRIADLKAGNDIVMKTTTSSETHIGGSSSVLNKVAELKVMNENGQLNLTAGRDVNLQITNVEAMGTDGSIDVMAGRNIGLTAQEISEKQDFTFKHGYHKETATAEIGTNFTASGNVNLMAGETLNAKAFDVIGDSVNITVGKDVNLEAGRTTSYVEDYSKIKSKGRFKSSTTTKFDIVNKDESIGTSISGNSITVRTGEDLNVKGSSIAATDDVNITAQGKVNVESSTDTIAETHYSKTKKSGLLSGGGFGFTIGKQSSMDDLQQQNTYEYGSIIGSIDGNVNIIANKDIDVKASDIIAGGNINLVGSEVNIEAGQENSAYQYKHEEKMSGLHISLGGGVVGTVQENIVQPLERANQVNNEKLSALYGIKAASKIKETGNVVKNAIADTKEGNKADWAHINIGIGSSKSTYKENGSNTIAVGSEVMANKDINVTATEKDINVHGSNLTGENINLAAKGNVNITAKENKSEFDSKDNKSGSEIGVSFSVNGMSVYANAYGMKEKGEGTNITHTGSNVKAEDTLNIVTGQDTNIIGSKAGGEKVNADIGGNLNIESLQDTETQKWDSKNYGISGSIGLSGTIDGKGGIDISTGSSKVNSDYNSVTEQAGTYAGSRGFDITVEGNTDLKGAVIASEAAADKNNLTTGTLSFDDIENKTEYDTQGYGISYSGQTNQEKEQNGRPVMQGEKGIIPNITMASGEEKESSTKSAVAEGTINITNPEQQKQNIKKLKRETRNTLNKLDKIFDKDKIEEKQELAGLFSELSFNAIHNLSKNWTEEQKMIAHALVGYVSGELANSKSSFSTALTAGVNKFVTEEITKDPKAYRHYQEHPEELQWLSAALGAAIGQMANGDATSGASIASSGTKNNWLYRDEQEELARNIEEITNKKFLNEGDVQQLTSLMQEAGLISKENIVMDPIHSENIIPELRFALDSIKTTDFIGVKFRTDDSIGLDKNIENFNNDFAKTYYGYKPVNDVVADIEKNLITYGTIKVVTFLPYGGIIAGLYTGGDLAYNAYKFHNGDDKAREHLIVDLSSIAVGQVYKEQFILRTTIQAIVNSAIDNSDRRQGGDK